MIGHEEAAVIHAALFSAYPIVRLYFALARCRCYAGSCNNSGAGDLVTDQNKSSLGAVTGCPVAANKKG